LIKPTPDLSKASISKSQGLLIERGAKVMKPSDRNAVEFALRLAEKLSPSEPEKNKSEVVALSLAGPEGEGLLKEAMALGADRAVILSDPSFLEGEGTSSAAALARACLKLGAELILCGEGQVGHRVAEEMKIPSIASVVQIEADGSAPDRLKLSSRTGSEPVTFQCSIPLLAAVSPGSNTPRIANAIKIMKAAKKEILKWKPDEIGLAPGETGAAAAGMQVLRTFAPDSP
jgi:electron transfer flavoprotein beta subunit